MTKTTLNCKNFTANNSAEVLCSVERMEREAWVNCFKRDARDLCEHHMHHQIIEKIKNET